MGNPFLRDPQAWSLPSSDEAEDLKRGRGHHLLLETNVPHHRAHAEAVRLARGDARDSIPMSAWQVSKPRRNAHLGRKLPGFLWRWRDWNIRIVWKPEASTPFL